MPESVSLSGAPPSEIPRSLWVPRPWRAGLLNLLMPGLGQLYNGRPRRALVSGAVLALWMLVAIGAAVAAPFRPLRIALMLVAILGHWIAFAWDAARIARRTSPSTRRWFQRWYSLVAFAALWVLALQPGIVALTKRHISEAYRIPSGGMAPTVLTGDYILVSKWDAGAADREDVVVFRQGGGNRTVLQRVVGIPGDTVAMRAHRLLRNGQSVVESYAQAPVEADPAHEDFDWQRGFLVTPEDSVGYRPTLGNWGPLLLPPNHYFLLGDNRGSSYDSRYTGFVSADRVIGRPRWIYYSRDPERAEHRWSRIGLAIR